MDSHLASGVMRVVNGKTVRWWIPFGVVAALAGAACEEPAPGECSSGLVACTCADGTAGTRACASPESACDCGAVPGGDTDAGPDATTAQDAQTQLDGSGPDATLNDATADTDATTDTQCGQQSSQAEIPTSRPVDVIFIIDNSGSMGDEITGVERNINQNFAQIIEASGADYRVIMITERSAGTYGVCIDPPLADSDCGAEGPRFFHLDQHTESWDSVCYMLNNYGDGLLTGWGRWLREDALKVFVEITDDRLSCSALGMSLGGSGNDQTSAALASRDVIAAIRSLSTAQFGSPQEPKFVWHSLVGVPNNDPPDLPYTHVDPFVSGSCSTAGPGPVYQMMSISTGGLRFPVCAADEGYGYDAVFRAIAREVVRGAQVQCSFDIPEAPDGKFVDYASVKVEYTPGGGGAAEQLGMVDAVDDCDDASFYFDGRDILLCDAACDRVRADDQAQVGVVFRCGEETDVPVVLQ